MLRKANRSVAARNGSCEQPPVRTEIELREGIRNTPVFLTWNHAIVEWNDALAVHVRKRARLVRSGNRVPARKEVGYFPSSNDTRVNSEVVTPEPEAKICH